MAEYIYRAEPIGEGEYSHTLVGELVRCEECKWHKKRGWCVIFEALFTDDFYCAYGEKERDDEVNA